MKRIGFNMNHIHTFKLLGTINTINIPHIL